MLKIRTTQLKGKEVGGAIRLINDLLLMGIDVRRVVTSRGTRAVSAGDFLIDEKIPGIRGYAKKVAAESGFKILSSTTTGFDSYPRIRAPIVGIYCGAGVSPSCLLGLVDVLNEMGFAMLSFVNSETLSESLENLDAIIFPGGDSTEIVLSVGMENARAIRIFVEKGGSFIGICAGAFMGMNSKSGRLGPDDEEYRKIQGEIGAIEGEVLNDLAQVPPAPMWSFKKFDDIYRVYPYEGPFRFKVRTSKHPISLAVPKKITLWMEGPAISLMDAEAKSVVEFDSAIDTSVYGIKKEMVKRMFSSFSALVTKKVGKGNYIVSSAHIDSPRYPEGWLILANSLFHATFDSALVSLPPPSAPLSPRQSALFAASIMDQSEELSRSLQRLRRSILALLPLVTSASLRLGQDMSDVLSSLLQLPKICDRISENMVSILDEEVKLERLKYSLTMGPISSSRDAHELDYLTTVISRITSEKDRMLATAGRAMPALTMISLKLEKDSAELFTKTTKGEPTGLFEQTAVLIREFVGDKCFYVPWYDGKRGIIELEGRNKSEGIIPPLLGICMKTEHIRRILKLTRYIAVC